LSFLSAGAQRENGVLRIVVVLVTAFDNNYLAQHEHSELGNSKMGFDAHFYLSVL
jgi:hypothetical protein